MSVKPGFLKRLGTLSLLIVFLTGLPYYIGTLFNKVWYSSTPPSAIGTWFNGIGVCGLVVLTIIFIICVIMAIYTYLSGGFSK